MDAKFKKLIVKGVVGLVSTALIGYIYKVDKRLDEAIDEYFNTSAS